MLLLLRLIQFKWFCPPHSCGRSSCFPPVADIVSPPWLVNDRPKELTVTVVDGLTFHSLPSSLLYISLTYISLSLFWLLLANTFFGIFVSSGVPCNTTLHVNRDNQAILDATTRLNHGRAFHEKTAGCWRAERTQT